MFNECQNLRFKDKLYVIMYLKYERSHGFCQNFGNV